jgi:tripartite-type tricarboxylate transporter receptor subunit TctC
MGRIRTACVISAVLAAAAASAGFTAPAFAQSYPSRPVRMVVP